MAKKETRGLPPDFDLDLPIDKPVELGDYLDEVEARPAVTPNLESHAPAPVAAPVPLPPPPPMSGIASYPQRASYLSRQQLRPGAVPRKQLNATPDTMRMLDELLMQIRQQSMEKDV